MTKLVLAIFGVVVILTGVLLGVYFSQARPGASVKGEAISFVSEKDGFGWEVNKDFAVKLEGLIAPKIGESGKKVLVVLSPVFKTTDFGVGSGELDPFAYAEWTASSNENVLNIYLNEGIWAEIGESDRNKSISMLVADRVLSQY